jgi:hypothetical protein
MNTTSVATGERVLVTNKKNVGLRPAGVGELPRPLDLFELAPEARGITVPEAIVHSARFPYVTPGGRLETRDADELGIWALNRDQQHGNDLSEAGKAKEQRDFGDARLRRDRDYLVDGGYYENYGAETMFEAIHQVRAVVGPSNVRLIVIHNGTVWPRDLMCDSRRNPDYRNQRELRPFARMVGVVQNWNEPLLAYEQARQARGRQGLLRLRETIGCDQISESYFDPIDGSPSPALSWYLDPDMRMDIRAQAWCILDDIAKEDPGLFPQGIPSSFPGKFNCAKS